MNAEKDRRAFLLGSAAAIASAGLGAFHAIAALLFRASAIVDERLVASRLILKVPRFAASSASPKDQEHDQDQDHE